jgi:hypothetical protein
VLEAEKPREIGQRGPDPGFGQQRADIDGLAKAAPKDSLTVDQASADAVVEKQREHDGIGIGDVHRLVDGRALAFQVNRQAESASSSAARYAAKSTALLAGRHLHDLAGCPDHRRDPDRDPGKAPCGTSETVGNRLCGDVDPTRARSCAFVV